MAEVGGEHLRQHPERGSARPSGGQRDGQGADGLAVRPVHDAAGEGAERADAVAGAEEGEVGRDDPLGEGVQLGLDAVLDRRLGLVGVGGVEGPAAQDDARPVVEVDLAEGRLLQPDADQLVGVQAGAGEHGVVLLLGDVVLRAGAEEQEGAHRLRPGSRRRWPAARPRRRCPTR